VKYLPSVYAVGFAGNGVEVGVGVGVGVSVGEGITSVLTGCSDCSAWGEGTRDTVGVALSQEHKRMDNVISKRTNLHKVFVFMSTSK
jgi:hypothetical protein